MKVYDTVTGIRAEYQEDKERVVFSVAPHPQQYFFYWCSGFDDEDELLDTVSDAILDEELDSL